ncbi:hypothetical protein TrRE_jg4139 [Triparma retinervis]|uniref:Uncharacterized protein n=1 Tax=Triparma retinervis TaxID=2557542 RepID=A0A9W7CG92_9STRA|nr:hypothetical protein TrRE_jg4139 [Triparma retinervis]
MTSKDVDTIAVLALLSSIGSAAIMSAFISFDYDTDRLHRIKNPEFYGYIGKSNKTKLTMFAALFSLSFFNLFVRSLTVVTVSIVGGKTLVITVLTCEMLLYFIVKLARRDFHYWTPVYGWLGIVMSVVSRVVVKAASDWTALVQFRHPQEVGGVYFTFTVGLSVVLGGFAAFAYSLESHVGHAWSDDQVTAVMASGCAMLALSFVVAVLSMKEPYRRTLLCMNTGTQHITQGWNDKDGEDCRDDKVKMEIFGANRHKWIWKEDVKKNVLGEKKRRAK